MSHDGHDEIRDHTLALPTVSVPLVTLPGDVIGEEVEAMLAAGRQDRRHSHSRSHSYPVSSLRPAPRTTSPWHGSEDMAADPPAHHLAVLPTGDGLGAVVGDHGRVTVMSELRGHPVRLGLILLAAIPMGYLAGQPLVDLTHPRGAVSRSGTAATATATPRPADHAGLPSAGPLTHPWAPTGPASPSQRHRGTDAPLPRAPHKPRHAKPLPVPSYPGHYSPNPLPDSAPTSQPSAPASSPVTGDGGGTAKQSPS